MYLRRLPLSAITVVLLYYTVLMKTAPLSVSHSIVDSIASAILFVKFFVPVFGYKKSTRRDSNPRPSPWQGDTPPLSHSCMLRFLQPNNMYYTDVPIVCQQLFQKYSFSYFSEKLQQTKGQLTLMRALAILLFPFPESAVGLCEAPR